MLAPSTFASRYDAVIVGARCAGSATALLLARAGLRVLVVDRGRHGTDTLSTHALMRGAVLQLQQWGVLPAIQAAGTPTVRRATFVYGSEPLSVPIKPRDGIDGLYAPRRTVIDRVLADAAMAAGAQVEYGVRLVELVRGERDRITGVELADEGGTVHRIGATVTIGADGLRSTMARLAGAGITRAGRSAAAVVFGYWAGVPVDGYRWYFSPGLSAGAIPTNHEETCVFAATPATRFADTFRGNVASGYHQVLAEVAPDIAARLGEARLSGSLHGFPGQPGFFRRSAGAGWALVGDAGYFKDPITAHGITDALIAADLLARAVIAGGDEALAEYEATRDRIARPLFEVTDRIASFDWTLSDARALHRALSDEMTEEVRVLTALHDQEVPA
jgi:flavin-dependent dehydrogenase